MGDETKANQAQADKINGCDNNQTCVDEEIKKISNELIITDSEVAEIKAKEQPSQETSATLSEPTPTPVAGGEEIQYGQWVKPSRSVCESSGGNYGEFTTSADDGTKYEGTLYTECWANWENAHTICSATGGVLPNNETLKAVVTDCGGVIDDYENNRNSESYQACYREKGFTSSYYWSSTSDASDSSNAWIVNFSNGHVDWNDKTYELSVRCVRGGQ
nr:DUF1566 domain-containing protein [Sulfurovum sp. bin170]